MDVFAKALGEVAQVLVRRLFRKLEGFFRGTQDRLRLAASLWGGLKRAPGWVIEAVWELSGLREKDISRNKAQGRLFGLATHFVQDVC